MKVEKALEKIRRHIEQRDKKQRRLLRCIDLAIEHISTDASVMELAKRHNLSVYKVRRYIDNAVFLARSRMFERDRAMARYLGEK
jgi:transcriptional regulator GlxA family with amidase domain